VEASRHREIVELWQQLPRKEGRVVYPDLVVGRQGYPKPLGGNWDWSNIPPDVLQAFVEWLQKWILYLKQATYYIDIWNNTEWTIPDLVVTYFLNELTDSNQIVTIGPYPAEWPNFQPGQEAEFAISGCLYMKSYAVTLVWEDGTIDEVLPNTSVYDINTQYDEAHFGQIEVCSDVWEIFVPPA